MIRKLGLFIIKLGSAVGTLSSIILPRQKVWYPVYLLIRGYKTGRNKSLFSNFGNNSILARDITLLHAEKISIGNNSSIMAHCVLETLGDECLDGIAIGDNVSLGEYSHITCKNKITIGNNVLTGRYVLITDNSHGDTDFDTLNKPPLQRRITSKGPVTIGDNVWIGDKVTILPNVSVGTGCVIAANSVVTSNIPPYSVAAGIPARIIKSLN